MVTEKISCITWGSRIIFEQCKMGSVKTYAIFKNNCSLALAFFFRRVKKI